MKGTIGETLRNAAAVFAGTLLQKLISLYTLRALATRMDRIAPHMFGDWNTVFIFLGFFGILADFNLDVMVVRELSRPDRDHGRVLGNALLLKLALCAAALLGVLSLVWVAPYPPALRRLILLAAFALPFSCLTLFRAACQARFQQQVTQGYNIAATLAILAAMLLLLRARAGLGWFVAAQAFVALPVNLVFAVRASRVIRPSFQFDPVLCRELFRSALPLGLSAALGMISYRFDALYLSWVRETKEVGLYAAVYRLTEAFSFVPGAVISAVYPAMAGMAAGERERLRAAFAFTARWLLILALPLLLTTTLYSPEAMAWMYGPRYAAAAPALRWLGLAEFLMFFSPLFYHLLLALNLNRPFFLCAIGFTSLNVLGNLALVSRYGFTASAAVTAATEAAAILLAFRWLRGTDCLAPPERAGRTLLSAGMTALLLAPLGIRALWPGIAAILTCYAAALFATRALTVEDVRFLSRAIRSRT